MSAANPPCIHLLLDWDGTLSHSDTLSTIAAIGYARNPHVQPWSSISAAYMSDFSAHVKAYKPRAEDRRTVREELEFLESLRGVERASVERVERAGIWRGVRGSDVDSGAREAIRGLEWKEGGCREEDGERGAVEPEVCLRSGWAALMARVWEGGGEVGVVSVNWSRMFIRRCMVHAAGVVREEGKQAVERLEEVLSTITIRTNEIEGLEDEEGGIGTMSRYFKDEGEGIWTAADKERVLNELLGDRSHVGRQGETLSVYVGDSATDLCCLMRTHVGVVIRDQPIKSGQKDLKRICERLSINVRPIAEYGDHCLSDSNAGKSLWWAGDFNQILDSRLTKG
ncbi:MAG: hypothetical protein M1827_000765 [Pycnora praestabilis]|nr:MAG: hypothetical protein M1827_000765 [Pycnora praestabilis]